MGIPVFFSWITEKYPSAIHFGTAKAKKCHNLYLDFNGIIHNCSHNNKANKNPTDDEIRENIEAYLDELIADIRPKKLLYIAVDGVAPAGKLNEQRTRRFRTTYESPKIRRAYEARQEEWREHGLDPGLLPASGFESNVITVGTEWLADICKWLHKLVREKQVKDENWRKLTIILDDVNVPGEGEHKIQDYLRSQDSKNFNDVHVVYGQDADLLLLSFLRKQRIFILRDEREERYRDWVVVDIKELGKKLVRDMTHSNLLSHHERSRVLGDFVLLASFIGNDFVPGLMALSLAYDRWGVELLINCYARLYFQNGSKTITCEKKVFVEQILDFLRIVREHEAHRLRVMSRRTEKVFEQRKLFLLKGEARMAKIRERLEWYLGERSLRSDGIARNVFLKHGNRFPTSLAVLYEPLKQMRVSPGEISAALQASPSLDCSSGYITLASSYTGSTDPLTFEDDLSHVRFQMNQTDLILARDRLELGTPDWKDRYYKQRFGVASSEIMGYMMEPICEQYLQTVLWVYAYYLNGLPSWHWRYDHHYAPCVDELIEVRNPAFRKSFHLGSPISQSTQLMSVLPKPVLQKLQLPEPYLAAQQALEKFGFYPKTVRYDYSLTRNSYLGKFELPHVQLSPVVAICDNLKADPKAKVLKYQVKSNHDGNDVVKSSVVKHKIGVPYSLQPLFRQSPLQKCLFSFSYLFRTACRKLVM